MNKLLWQYVSKIDPFAEKRDVESIKELNEWDLLITFTTGRKVIFDKYTGYYKDIFYKDVNEITEEQEKKEFAYRLRSFMGRKMITQDQLAETINVSRVMISKYVRGEAMPSVIVAKKIANVLGCSLDDLFHTQI